MDKREFDRAVREIANGLIRRKMLVLTLVSVVTAGVVATVVAKMKISSMSVDEDWSDADWGIDDDNAELI